MKTRERGEEAQDRRQEGRYTAQKMEGWGVPSDCGTGGARGSDERGDRTAGERQNGGQTGQKGGTRDEIGRDRDRTDKRKMCCGEEGSERTPSSCLTILHVQRGRERRKEKEGVGSKRGEEQERGGSKREEEEKKSKRGGVERKNEGGARERGCKKERERKRERERGDKEGILEGWGGVRDDRYKKRDTERDGGTREKGSKREGQRRGAKRGKGQEERAGRGKEQDERRKGGRERRRHERREKAGVHGKEKREF